MSQPDRAGCVDDHTTYAPMDIADVAAPTPRPHAERAPEGEVTSAVMRAEAAIYESVWGCPRDEDRTPDAEEYQDARTVLDAALGDGSEIVAVLAEHDGYWQRDAERPDERWYVCRCGMELETSRPAVPEAFRYHLADRITYALAGGAA